MATTLKVLRAKKDITQSELAEKTGISQTTISNWESGKSNPSIQNIYRLANFYAVEPTVIFNAIKYK